jgi:RNA polymerase sigma factor (sigma-70 family)
MQTETGEKHYSGRLGGDMPQAISSSVVSTLLEHRERFLSFLERRVGSRAVAEDILQMAFLRALQQPKLRQEESAVAWFYRVLRNAVIDHYRHEAVSGRMLEQWAREIETSVEPDTETRASVCECILEVLPELKLEYQQAIQAIDLDEKSLKEFGEQAGISPTNAGVRVHRARQALKKQVVKTCGACAKQGCIDCDCARVSKKERSPAA